MRTILVSRYEGDLPKEESVDDAFSMPKFAPGTEIVINFSRYHFLAVIVRSVFEFYSQRPITADATSTQCWRHIYQPIAYVDGAGETHADGTPYGVNSQIIRDFSIEEEDWVCLRDRYDTCRQQWLLPATILSSDGARDSDTP